MHARQNPTCTTATALTARKEAARVAEVLSLALHFARPNVGQIWPSCGLNAGLTQLIRVVCRKNRALLIRLAGPAAAIDV
mmetsp:Transcript_40359/g.88604  ORF Transcript_40359/g.88604 Transcript_40359/m.88604 type:complete len:80 (+) Transcript_40359:598-837(+)